MQHLLMTSCALIMQGRLWVIKFVRSGKQIGAAWYIIKSVK